MRGARIGLAAALPDAVQVARAACTGKFFVHYLTRDCAALKDLPGWPRNCTAITADMVPTSGSATARGDPALFDTLIVGIRDYVRPGTRSGPDSTQLLRPRVLAFTKQ